LPSPISWQYGICFRGDEGTQEKSVGAAGCPVPNEENSNAWTNKLNLDSVKVRSV